MKTCIHFFTGTGNSSHAANVIAETLKSGKEFVELVNISDGGRFPAENFDRHIFIFPTYSWSAPAMMRKYIRNLPKMKGEDCAAIAVFGGSVHGDGNAGQGVAQIKRMLKRRGLNVTLTGGLPYPTNWIQFTNTPESDICQKIRRRADSLAEELAGKFLKGERGAYRATFFGYLSSWLMAHFFNIFGRKMLGKMFTADDSCTKCGLCAKRCPAKTIRMNGFGGKPYWGERCENCNRCMNICPSGSIQTSIPRMIIHLSFHVATIFWSISIATYINRMSGIKGYVSSASAIALFIAIFMAFYYLQLYALDKVLFFLQRFSIIDRVLSFSFTKKFRRYKAPDFR